MKIVQLSPLTALILSVLILAPAFVFAGTHFTGPSDGTRLEPGNDNLHVNGVEISLLRPQPGGLENGDIITAIDGRSMEAWAQALFAAGANRPEWQPGDTVTYTVNRNGEVQEIEVVLGSYPLGEVLGRNWGTILFAVVFQIVATFIFIRRPANYAGRVLFLSASCILSATTWSLGLQPLDFIRGSGFWLYKMTTLGAYSLFWITGFHFAAVFPRPLPVISKRPWILLAGYLSAAGFMAIWILITRSVSASTLDWLSLWIPAEAIVAGIFLVLALAAFFAQYRIHKFGATRQQIRWVVWAAILSGGTGLFFYILPGLFGATSINPNLAGLIVLPFPLAIAVAIMRYNLFEIDRLINRTLVYGTLVLVSGGIYLLVVGTFAVFFQAQGNWLISLAATGVVAVLFHPMRERINRWINRRMYGDRDEPFEVLARLGQRLETTLSPDAVLPTLVETVAQALKLPYVGLRLPDGPRTTTAASFGRPTTSVSSYPLLNQGETIGELVIARRAEDEVFTEEEERLLGSIARQAGAAVQTVLLTADLQRSHQRLVTAQEEERRRLRRDLHDGLGPTLAAHMLKIGLARTYLHRDIEQVDKYLEQLEEDTEDILSEVRRLVYNLRPPTLDQLGLVGAIKACADDYNHAADTGEKLRVQVRAPEKTPLLPAAVEVAAYRIVQEALTNASRHAQATSCTIDLHFDHDLSLKIRDDGLGLPEQHRAGVGLNSMRERAVELGGNYQMNSSAAGGTELVVKIPIHYTGEKEG
jgi:two-component system, NarL family, sensor kinase